MSMRAKLSALTALAVALSAISFSGFAFLRFSEKSLDFERDRFIMLGTMVVDELENSYFNFLSGQIGEIVRQKRSLRQESRLFLKSYAALEKNQVARPEFLEVQLDELGSRGLSLAFFGSDGQRISLGNKEDLFDWATVKDYTGKPLSEALDPDDLPVDGRFLVLRSGEESFLALLMPDAGRLNILVSCVSLTEMKAQALATTAGLIEGIKRILPVLPLGRAKVAILDAGGQVLVNSGETVFRPDPEFLETAKSEGSFEKLVGPKDGRILYFLQYFKPLGWYVALEASQELIVAQARDTAFQILIVGAGFTIFFLILSIVLTTWFTRPLWLVNLKATQAASLEFTSPEAEKFFGDWPLARRRDEIGQLAQSFLKMGQTIILNVKQLVESAKARERIDGELSAARRIQEGMLPAESEAPNEKDFQAAAFLLPAKEVGGDFYDFFTAPDGRRVLVIGDVSDKGVPAALFMTMVLTLVRSCVATGLEPDRVLAGINTQLSLRNPGSMFVTIFLALFDPQSGLLTYANGGHCPPMFKKADGSVVILEEDVCDPLVGAWPDLDYHLRKVSLAPGEICFLYTDGITEAQNGEGGFFGEGALESFLASLKEPLELDKIIKAVYEEILGYRGLAPQSDDITMLAFRRVDDLD